MPVLEMPQMTDSVRDTFQRLINDISKGCPSKGKMVEIENGKHAGKSGVVFWHGKDRFDRDTFRYATFVQATMREAKGTYGYRIGVETADGEKFFTKAEYAIVQGGGE